MTIPICLVTGFLGSGKTTLLKQIIDRHGELRIVYLVNEFSPVDIDGELLDREDEEVVAIPGGSIFCRCLVTQFIGRLQTIAELVDDPGRTIDGVVIEASGVANPMVVQQMLEETRLDEQYELATIICVVDPGSLPKLVHTLPNIRAQVKAADVVLINKTDLFDAAEIAATEQIVREIAPGARVIRTVRCDVDLAIFEGGQVRTLRGEYAMCADPNYARFSVPVESDISVERLREALEALGDELYRAKGFVTSGGHTYYVDANPAGVSIERVDRRPAWLGLAIVSRGDEHGAVDDLVRRVRAGDLRENDDR